MKNKQTDDNQVYLEGFLRGWRDSRIHFRSAYLSFVESYPGPVRDSALGYNAGWIAQKHESQEG